MNTLAYRVLFAETERWIVNLPDQRLALWRVCMLTQWIISPSWDTLNVEIMQIYLLQIVNTVKKKWAKPFCCLKQFFI